MVGLIPVYFGAAEEAARTLAPLLAASAPVLDLTKPMSYQEVQRLTDGLNPPAMHHYYASEWLHYLDDQRSQTRRDGRRCPSPSSGNRRWATPLGVAQRFVSGISDLDGDRPQPPMRRRVRLPHSEGAFSEGAAAYQIW